MDEAPLFVVTDFNATVFLRRSSDVYDNHLWASEPVWDDQSDPPARAAWVNALQEAAQLRHLKRRLPRTLVPPVGRQAQCSESLTPDLPAATEESAEPGVVPPPLAALLPKRKRGAQQQPPVTEGFSELNAALAEDAGQFPASGSAVKSNRQMSLAL